MSNDIQEKHAWDDLSNGQKIEILKKKIEIIESEMLTVQATLGLSSPQEWGK